MDVLWVSREKAKSEKNMWIGCFISAPVVLSFFVRSLLAIGVKKDHDKIGSGTLNRNCWFYSCNISCNNLS